MKLHPKLGPAAALTLLVAVSLGFGLACQTVPQDQVTRKSASVKTFVEASLHASDVKAIAIFPIRNVRLQMDELREVNRGITDGFRRQNPDLKIVGAAESVTMLNEAGLADKYSEFLRNYSQSAIPDVKTLKEIGQALGVDAILQGEVFSIEQRDGTATSFGKTSLQVRYVLLATKTGTVLWEATGSAFKLTDEAINDKHAMPAPTLYEVIQIAQEKVLTALPTLGK
ncbi:MAG: hypothetical protein U1F98_12600 [Verrucomicrobiota bacterium]